MEKTTVEFYKNLASVLAHSVVYYAKEKYPVNLRCEQPKVPNLGAEYSNILGAVGQYLPSLGKIARSEIGPTEAARFASAQEISPQYAQLASDLYSKYMPQFQQADIDILRNLGPELGASYRSAQESYDPSGTAATELSSKKLSELLGSIDLNKPSIEAERLISQEAARSGNLITPSATGAVANALSFGKELQQRQNTLSNALNIANQFTATKGSQFNPVTQMAASNYGASQFPGVVQPGSEGYNTMANMFGTAAQTQSGLTQLGQARKTPLDVGTQVMQGL